MQRSRLGLAGIAAMALAATGMAAAATSTAPRQMTRQDNYLAGGQVLGGQPHRGTAGMAYGTKTRGNRAVQRASLKKRNQQRHRKACRA